MVEGMTRPWDRLPEETDSAWAAFSSYLGLGPKRTFIEAYRRYQDSKGVKWSANTPGSWWEDWITENRWIVRALEHDIQIASDELDQKLEDLVRHQGEAVNALRAMEGKGVIGLQSYDPVAVTQQLGPHDQVWAVSVHSQMVTRAIDMLIRSETTAAKVMLERQQDRRKQLTQKQDKGGVAMTNEVELERQRQYADDQYKKTILDIVANGASSPPEDDPVHDPDANG
jgi:hypothetical protein